MKTLGINKVGAITMLTVTLLLVMFGFTNCGQVEFGATNNKPGGDTLVVDPDNGGLSTPPGDNDGGGTTPPGGSGGGTTPPPPGHHNGDDCHGGPDKHQHHDGDGCKEDDDGNHDDDDDEDDDDGHEWNNHYGCNKACGNNGIKDIVVNIDHIEIRGTQGEVLTISGGDLGETSIIGGSLPIAVSEDIDIVSIRFVLASGGNYIIDNSNKQINLKTPSGQQSGVKVPFKGVTSVKAGSYTLKFSIDPQTQIVKAGKKCLLKPVLKFISFDQI